MARVGFTIEFSEVKERLYGDCPDCYLNKFPLIVDIYLDSIINEIISDSIYTEEKLTITDIDVFDPYADPECGFTD